MSIIPVLFLHTIAAACYLLNTRQRAKPMLAVSGVFLHTILFIWLTPSPLLGLGDVLSGFFLVTAATSRPKFLSTRRILYYLTAVAVFMPLILPPHATSHNVSLHAVLAIAAYAAAAGALFHWLDLRITEHLLHQSPQPSLSASLLESERRCFRNITLAFVLLTLTIISGGSAIIVADQPLALTHKNLFAALTWLTFLILLIGRYLYGWRGRTAQLWFGIGLVFLLLSYVGSTFIAEVIIH